MEIITIYLIFIPLVENMKTTLGMRRKSTLFQQLFSAAPALEKQFGFNKFAISVMGG
jgi:hypothetical protein